MISNVINAAGASDEDDLLDLSDAVLIYASLDSYTGQWSIDLDSGNEVVIPGTIIVRGAPDFSDDPYRINGLDEGLSHVGLEFVYGPRWYADPWGCGGWYGNVTALTR